MVPWKVLLQKLSWCSRLRMNEKVQVAHLILKRRSILAQKHNAVFKRKLFHEVSREVLNWNTCFARSHLAGFAVWDNGLKAQRTINSWACQTRKWCQYDVSSCKWKKKLLVILGSPLLIKRETWLVTSFWFGLNNLGELRSTSASKHALFLHSRPHVLLVRTNVFQDVWRSQYV